MAIKKAQWQIKGMSRDLAVSKFSSDYAYENMNMRLMSIDELTTLSLVNEKGTKKLDVYDGGILVSTPILGVPIGLAVIKEYLVLFTHHSSNIDYIYRFNYDYINNRITRKVIAHGNFNFNKNNPIETTVVYENEEIQKVYWVDGLNLPRVINIIRTLPIIDSSKLDFIPAIQASGYSTITKNTTGGNFPAGTILYFFTYFNLYGLETNIFNASPLYYCTNSDRGTDAEHTNTCSFNITITNPQRGFGYIRIYSLFRALKDSEPLCKVVADVAIPLSGNITYIDTGNTGYTISSDILLYVGGQSFIANTIEQKDNTLFLGNVLRSNTRLSFNNALPDVSFNDYKKLFKLDATPIYYSRDFQLNENSRNVKVFKFGETYRLGFLAQFKDGTWSEVFRLTLDITVGETTEHRDPINTLKIIRYADVVANENWIKAAKATAEFQTPIITELKDLNCIAIRPVMVIPKLSDRTILCLGVLNPTMYNVEDRADNSPFVLSSWFFRPNAPILLENTDLENLNLAYTEFRHNHPIPSNVFENSEILCIYLPPHPYLNYKHKAPISLSGGGEETRVVYTEKNNKNTWVQQNKEFFYVDLSIATLHSPEVEIGNELDDIDLSQYKLRIVGFVPIDACQNEFLIENKTPLLNYIKVESSVKSYYNEKTEGFYNNTYDATNSSNDGWKIQMNNPTWADDVYKGDTDNPNQKEFRYTVYPWNRNGSLNNARYASEGETKPAVLLKNIQSHNRFSLVTYYFSNITDDHTFNTSDIKLFNSDNVEAILLKYSNSNILYYGNINKIINISSAHKNFLNYDLDLTNNLDLPIEEYNSAYPITAYMYDSYLSSPSTYYLEWGWERDHFTPILNSHRIRSLGSIAYLKNNNDIITRVNKPNFNNIPVCANDPVSIKYKSTKHLVLSLNVSEEQEGTEPFTIVKKTYKILPTSTKGTDFLNSVSSERNYDTNLYYHHFYEDYYTNLNLRRRNKYQLYEYSVTQNPLFWEDSSLLYSIINLPNINNTEIINYLNSNSAKGFLWLGELYNNNVQNRYGGDTPEAIENNQWVVAGDTVALPDDNTTSVKLEWTEGDTYFQRYDCLKTYPFNNEDLNQVVDILSFLCETRINLDGRTDTRRGLKNNLTSNPTNFNLINKVYTLDNNYFKYYYHNPNKIDFNKYNNLITWTKTKTAGELVDTWTNVTLASTLELDGDKGEITKLKKFNNNLFAFLDKGISQILYNDNVQISSTLGVPIEIANSGKVSGKRYLSSQIGCPNKWSMCETPNGLYFIDDISKGIYLFNGQLVNISDLFGMHSFINKESKTIDPWYPETEKSSFVTYYDKINGDIFFINEDYCVAYNEALKSFTSFYNYENTPYFANLQDIALWVSKDKTPETTDNNYYIWEHREGEYNKFFNAYKPFWTTIIANLDYTLDKIYNNIEFRSDTYGSNAVINHTLTFNTLDVWNEYQSGTLNLKTDVKKKFRVWRANIPRNTGTRDRMRNPWLYLQLKMDDIGTDLINTKTVLHDIVVDYFV